MCRRSKSTSTDSESQFVKHLVANKGGRVNRAITFLGACGGLIITLVGVHDFYSGLDFPSHIIGATTVLSRCANGIAASSLSMDKLTILLVDTRGLAVISTQAVFLDIALADANDFIVVIMGTRSFHRNQRHWVGIATLYAGMPSHHPSSLPIYITDETSSCFLQRCNGVPTYYIC